MTEWTDFQHANCCPCHTTRKIAYNLEEAAARVGVSRRTLADQIANSYLLARYVGTKALISHEDLVTWLNSLPAEPRGK
jgi:excisionase family DNA binding protein